MGHKNVPNIFSLSHCLEQLFSCILTVIYVKAKKRRMRQCFRESHALYCRVPTVREKSVKNEKNSKSGKSQGILN